MPNAILKMMSCWTTLYNMWAKTCIRIKLMLSVLEWTKCEKINMWHQDAKWCSRHNSYSSMCCGNPHLGDRRFRAFASYGLCNPRCRVFFPLSTQNPAEAGPRVGKQTTNRIWDILFEKTRPLSFWIQVKTNCLDQKDIQKDYCC